MIIVLQNVLCKFCHEESKRVKIILQAAFTKMIYAAFPRCVQQAKRKANDKIGRQQKDINPSKSSNVIRDLAGFSFKFRIESTVFAVPLTFGALGCEQNPVAYTCPMPTLTN